MTDAPDDQKRRFSMTTKIVIGLVAGVFCGLFFGDYTTSIKWIGDAYVGLLQMAVLPYVAMSLITNVGRLSLGSGARLLRTSLSVMGILWLVGFLTLAIMTQAFPIWESGSFFSSRFTEEPPAPQWMDLFIPSNPFQSLAENSIPAVVVFCIGLGIALMHHRKKEKLLEPMAVMAEALSGLNKLVVKLTPLGLFAIVAHTTGTLDVGQFSLIQGYLLTYGVSAIILTFIVLPLLVASVTPIGYWDVLKAGREPLIAAFVIGNTFVVLPLLIDAISRLQQENHPASVPDPHRSDYLIPLAYPFPDIGRIVGLIFLPFAAWFFGSVIDLGSYPVLLGTGFLGSFGKPVITIPLLLNIAHLPSDIFNLFVASGVVAARFGDLMKTMHLMTFTILTVCILNGTIRIKGTKLVINAIVSVLLLVASAVLIRGYLTAEFQDRYAKEKLVTQREMIFRENSTIAMIVPEILSKSQPNPDPIAPGQTRVQRIKQRGKIRIGFDAGKMPFSYFLADRNRLVGFDIQMAYHLADDLGVGIEFVPIQHGNYYQQLMDDHYDVAMSAMEGNLTQAELIPAVDSYMSVTLAVVVPDYDKAMFRDVDNLLAIPDLKLAVIRGGFFAEEARKALPQNVGIVEIDSAAEYFDGRFREVNGLVISAESGSAWTLRRPGFTVTNPLQGRVQVPLYYMINNDRRFENFLQNWLTLERSRGTYKKLYDYWILGLDSESQHQRWCILRDVLGWAK